MGTPITSCNNKIIQNHQNKIYKYKIHKVMIGKDNVCPNGNIFSRKRNITEISSLHRKSRANKTSPKTAGRNQGYK